MYTTNLQVSNYTNRHYKVEINAAWITITDIKTKEIIYKRHANGGVWFDSTHRAIMEALHGLEQAVFSAVDSEKTTSEPKK